MVDANEKRIFEAEGTLNKGAEFKFLKEQVFCRDKTSALE